MKHILIIIIGSIMAVCCPHLNGQSTDSFDALKSNDWGVRKTEIEHLKQQRAQSIENLIAILNGNSDLEVKDSVAIALGNCRAAEAVDALIQHMHLDVRGRIIKGLLTDEEMFPVSTSLEKIGNPSIPVIIKYLGEKGSFLNPESGTEQERRNVEASALLLSALYHIDGDKDIVKLRLQKALSGENDPQKQARLQSALKTLDKMQFTN